MWRVKNLFPIAIAAATLALYAGVIAFGVRLRPGGLLPSGQPGPRSRSWRIERLSSISADRLATIEFGSRLFNETPVYSPAYVQSRISCSNCHLQGGAAPYASPVVGIAPSFPMYSKRAGRAITLEDRIQECITRSENGKPLPHDSREMKALLAYINWLSEPHRDQEGFVGRGLEVLPAMRPDPTHGAEVYSAQCAGCHGVDGEGTRRPFPPLWGPNSFNDGAGMNGIEKMAAFVQYNMPHNRKGILSPQDAFDVAAYIHEQPRPAFNSEYDHF
jgi:thiosulfate dehydrogenase